MTCTRVVLSLRRHQRFKKKIVNIIGDDWSCPIDAE